MCLLRCYLWLWDVTPWKRTVCGATICLHLFSLSLQDAVQLTLSSQLSADITTQTVQVKSSVDFQLLPCLCSKWTHLYSPWLYGTAFISLKWKKSLSINFLSNRSSAWLSTSRMYCWWPKKVPCWVWACLDELFSRKLQHQYRRRSDRPVRKRPVLISYIHYYDILASGADLFIVTVLHI